MSEELLNKILVAVQQNRKALNLMNGRMATKKDLTRIENRLNKKIGGVEQKLDEKIGGVEQKLDEKIDGVEKSLSKKVEEVENRLDIKIDLVRNDMVTKDYLEERLTHFRSDIVAHIDGLADKHRTLDVEMVALHSRQDRLESHVSQIADHVEIDLE